MFLLQQTPYPSLVLPYGRKEKKNAPHFSGNARKGLGLGQSSLASPQVLIFNYEYVRPALGVCDRSLTIELLVLLKKNYNMYCYK